MINLQGFNDFRYCILQRERDSNPRTCYSQRFSRPSQSTTLPSLFIVLAYPKRGAKVKTYSLLAIDFLNFLKLSDLFRSVISHIPFGFHPLYASDHLPVYQSPI